MAGSWAAWLMSAPLSSRMDVSPLTVMTGLSAEPVTSMTSLPEVKAFCGSVTRMLKSSCPRISCSESFCPAFRDSSNSGWVRVYLYEPSWFSSSTPYLPSTTCTSLPSCSMLKLRSPGLCSASGSSATSWPEMTVLPFSTSPSAVISLLTAPSTVKYGRSLVPWM